MGWCWWEGRIELKEYSLRKKLITNGCSFTRGHDVNDVSADVQNNKYSYSIVPEDYTLGEKTSWAFWLSKFTNKELYNIKIKLMNQHLKNISNC